jgi:hypothetical protein
MGIRNVNLQTRQLKKQGVYCFVSFFLSLHHQNNRPKNISIFHLPLFNSVAKATILLEGQLPPPPPRPSCTVQVTSMFTTELLQTKNNVRPQWAKIKYLETVAYIFSNILNRHPFSSIGSIIWTVTTSILCIHFTHFVQSMPIDTITPPLYTHIQRDFPEPTQMNCNQQGHPRPSRGGQQIRGGHFIATPPPPPGVRLYRSHNHR